MCIYIYTYISIHQSFKQIYNKKNITTSFHLSHPFAWGLLAKAIEATSAAGGWRKRQHPTCLQRPASNEHHFYTYRFAEMCCIDRISRIFNYFLWNKKTSIYRSSQIIHSQEVLPSRPFKRNVEPIWDQWNHGKPRDMNAPSSSWHS